LDALSLLCIEADVSRKIGYEDLIKDFAREKMGENYSTINKMEPSEITIIFFFTVKFNSMVYYCL